MIEDLREQRQIKDLPYVQQEKDNLVNIVGNIAGNVDVVERENKNGEAFKVANFSVYPKMMKGIRCIIIALLMERKVILQKTLSREIS